MLKIDYGDKKHIDYLKEEYLKIFPNFKDMENDWETILNEIRKSNKKYGKILPEDLSKLLVMEYVDLVEIYEKYPQNDINENPIKQLFNYPKYQPIISTFFCNKIGIHTCYYCDTAYINYFRYSKGKRTQFDLDHVLDKGRCPLLALCLFNFVPSCPTCNGPHIKGKRKMELTTDERRKLSPSSSIYDFENKVKIWIYNKKGSCSTTRLGDRVDEFELKFDTSKDHDYDKEIDFFYLAERYQTHKCEALRLLDLKERYTDSKIMEMARLIVGAENKTMSTNKIRIISQIQQDIFQTGFHSKFHRALGKLTSDILN